jgi:hypothetical protein
MIRRHALIGLLGLALVSQANAACVCRCVDGEMKPLCQSSIDLPPICPPTLCPIVPPRLAPLDPPRLPPLGTTECRQEQVFNPITKQYEWKRVCR